MSGNRGVVYVEPGKVEVRSIPFPDMVDPTGRKANHAVILRVVSTNICGSDQHMVRGRTTALSGLVLGHEITGEVIELGTDVLTLQKGDLVSVPFNVACGRCPMCKTMNTGVCLNVNTARPGGAYGYVDMGGWIGGQAEYVMVPYADFNLLKFPDRDRAMQKIRDLTCLSDILPTGYHGAVTAGVRPGTTVYIAGAGPVGMAAAASARLLGAAVTIVGDVNPTRLEHARKVGFETVDLSQDASLADQIAVILGEPEVDCAIDCVGFEARGHGHSGSQHEAPASVLNALMEVTRVAGRIGIPGLYVTDDPGAADAAARRGSLSVRLGLGWAKSHSFFTGQTPVMKYNRALMQAILWDRIDIASAVNVQIIPLDQAPAGYSAFDAGVSKKFVIDPHGVLAAHENEAITV
ncbi:glutathione-independent formaldehyde dehydrogenase [Paraburkholderia sp. BL6665CI2N2]|uniref:formaldehyde dehydrogenase, glutathione-independent n=1 Tax=Paraburkholderia sp. BL6665CI2N2 TaxID=1938806 RepID=UPI0010664694|nr:formaldehyde dehydrogenase, glutathione-independent [Paraburkholderia sp. BL6665CI2N2]TDY15501.1 glutathione-independent formaldehyde dehydrogenase [Paraburkholderia sp. BL6665CI2N2]